VMGFDRLSLTMVMSDELVIGNCPLEGTTGV